MESIQNNAAVFRSLVGQIKQIIEESRKKVAKDINIRLLLTYWQIGKLIVEKETLENLNQETSRSLILRLSKELTKEVGKGFSRSNLFNMRKFYTTYPDVQTVSGQLSWSHYCE